jgi:chaperonin GroES
MKKTTSAKVKLIPLHDKVLVKPLEDNEEMSPSGIIIPDTVGKEKTDRGLVVAAGPGRYDEDGEKRIPLDVKEGDTVIFQWGDKIEFDGEEYFLVSESNISAIIK